MAEEVDMRFRDRRDAGRRLAEVVRHADLGVGAVAVLGLPRGGVPVAFEIARALRAPLDVIVVRKLGVPFQPELAMGAIGEEGVRVENRDVLQSTALTASDLDTVETRERAELRRRAEQYREGRPRLDLGGRCAIIVDDGIATGSTMRAACQVAHVLGAARIVVAVPVASRQAVAALRDVCDEVLSVEVPEQFFAVGEWYRDFSQASDDQVVDLLRRAATGDEGTTGPRRAEPPWRDEEIQVRAGPVELSARITVPTKAIGTVVFAHGSGSSRHSPRNRYVASVLNEAGLATLLIDLLDPAEELQRSYVFDIRLLAERLGDATRWIASLRELESTRIGLFGASTGAAAAMWAAAQPDSGISAVVSRGGRADLAAPLLAAVTAPTLFIVGGCDESVLDLNRKAQAELRCESRLAVVPGANHLFEEPGTLEAVAVLARDWFSTKLGVTSG
jgi:predicted phosphoribosyltransferase/dienelactone hydrolase